MMVMPAAKAAGEKPPVPPGLPAPETSMEGEETPVLTRLTRLFFTAIFVSLSESVLDMTGATVPEPRARILGSWDSGTILSESRQTEEGGFEREEPHARACFMSRDTMVDNESCRAAMDVVVVVESLEEGEFLESREKSRVLSSVVSSRESQLYSSSSSASLSMM